MGCFIFSIIGLLAALFFLISGLSDQTGNVFNIGFDYVAATLLLLICGINIISWIAKKSKERAVQQLHVQTQLQTSQEPHEQPLPTTQSSTRGRVLFVPKELPNDPFKKRQKDSDYS